MSNFKKYKLSDDELIQIARLCVQEQGSIAGVRAEASQGANLLETNATYRKRFGSGIYSMFRNSGWYYKAPYFMDNGSASEAAVNAVRDVLIEGNRVFPQYVDEHDCLSDIKSVQTNGKFVNKNDRSNYVRGKTIITNAMGSKYTFWEFPAPGCDPFGYTAAAYKYVMENGGSPDVPEILCEEHDGDVAISIKLPELYENCPPSNAVRLWRFIVGENTKYKTFKSKLSDITKEWQKAHGLSPDGIVGKRTWSEGLKTLK